MSINLDTATTEEIVAEYGVGIVGITEVLGLIAAGLDAGIYPDTAQAGADLVQGFVEGNNLLATLPADLLDKIKSSPAGEVLGASRFVIDLHTQALAASLVSTPLSLGLTLADLSIAITRLDAANGNVEAQEALKSAEAQGLL